MAALLDRASSLHQRIRTSDEATKLILIAAGGERRWSSVA
jgi:hypothetical protein